MLARVALHRRVKRFSRARVCESVRARSLLRERAIIAVAGIYRYLIAFICRKVPREISNNLIRKPLVRLARL